MTKKGEVIHALIEASRWKKQQNYIVQRMSQAAARKEVDERTFYWFHMYHEANVNAITALMAAVRASIKPRSPKRKKEA